MRETGFDSNTDRDYISNTLCSRIVTLVTVLRLRCAQATYASIMSSSEHTEKAASIGIRKHWTRRRETRRFPKQCVVIAGEGLCRIYVRRPFLISSLAGG